MGKIAIEPPYAHAVFNPVTFKVEKSDGEKSNYADLVVTKYDLEGAPTDASVTLRREYFNGEAWFDISGVLKNWFTEEKFQLDGPAYNDGRLFVAYSVSLDGVLPAEPPYLGVNAVVQCGEDPGIDIRVPRFLTRFPKLKKYRGYPLEVSCMYDDPSVENFLFHLSFNGFFVAEYPGPHLSVDVPDGVDDVTISDDILFIPLKTNEDGLVTTNEIKDSAGNSQGTGWIYVRNQQTGVVPVETGVLQDCLKLSPFYVRWINRLGGFDYWMFYQNQTYSLNAKTATTVEPVMRSIKAAGYIVREIDKTAELTVKVGSGNLTSEEYDAISESVTAPHVDYWNTDLHKWIRIYAENAKLETNTNEMRKEIEIEFTLPVPQLQF